MSEGNKELCRRYIEEVWNNRNMAAIDELFGANFIDHDPSSPDFGRGPESVRKRVNYYVTAFPDTRFSIEELLAEGDHCVIRWTVRATHRGELRGVPPTGRQVTITGTTTARVANGKFVESYSNWDALGLMQQLGAVEKQRAVGRAAG
ncbi:MAG: ester cyclase [Bryobacteraceae bacterium]|jgi:steroid delta-isomerase-like uncharacterized protein